MKRKPRLRKVVLKEWGYVCGETGCCYEYGTELWIDGALYMKNINLENPRDIEELIRLCGGNAEVDWDEYDN